MDNRSMRIVLPDPGAPLMHGNCKFSGPDIKLTYSGLGVTHLYKPSRVSPLVRTAYDKTVRGSKIPESDHSCCFVERSVAALLVPAFSLSSAACCRKTVRRPHHYVGRSGPSASVSRPPASGCHTPRPIGQTRFLGPDCAIARRRRSLSFTS